MENFHRHKWMMYAAIVLLTLVAGWFIVTVISNVSLDKNHERQQQIEVMRKEVTARADSIDRLIKTEKQIQTQNTESLARRVTAIKKTAAAEKQTLLKQYEKAFKDILSASDDSIALLDRCNRAKYDSLFARYHLYR